MVNWGLVQWKQIAQLKDFLLTEMQQSGSVLLECNTLVILGQYCVLPGPLPRPQASEEGGGGHHEQHPPHLQHQVLNDQEGVDEGS